jgi:TolB-like protein
VTNQGKPTTSRLRRRIGWALALLVACGLAASFAWRREHAANAPYAGPALLVVPLHAEAARSDDGIDAAGLSEELVAHSARIDGLRVIGNASAQHAAAAHLESAQLAERLGVTHTLQGDLREAGDLVQVDLRLIELTSGRVLWAQTFENHLADIAVLEEQVAHAVAAALALPLAPAAAAATPIDVPHLRAYWQARGLLTGPQRARGIDMLRELSVAAPEYARAHATLARALSSMLRGGTPTSADFDEAAREAARALELDADLSELHTTLGILACRAGDWLRCMAEFKRALALDRSDVEARLTYTYWLSALGYIDRALHESETAWSLDPLNYNASFARARVLDTAGRHTEAAHYLDALSAESGGLVYAKWHNAVWRHDLASAVKLTAAMPRSDGFHESYVIVTEALTEPRLWPQALPLISTSERANGGINVQRIMMPNPDYPIVITGLEKMLRDGWPSYYMLLWMPEYAALRRDPAFQEFLKRTRLPEFWRENGWPPQCHPQGDGAQCD